MYKIAFAGACLGLASLPAYADVTLHNKDSRAHQITIACAAGTIQRSIQPGSIATLGRGPCLVTVKATSLQLRGGGQATLVIPPGAARK